MEKLDDQIDDARAACNAYWNAKNPNFDFGVWELLPPDCQNAWHRVVEAVRERAKGEAR